MYDEAHEDYDRAIALSPNDPKFWHSKGLAFQGKSEEAGPRGDPFFIDKATEMYMTALSITEHHITSRFHLGLMFHKNNKFHEALKCFSNVLAKIPDDKTVYIARGLVY